MVGEHDRHHSLAQSPPNLRFCNEIKSAEFFNTKESIRWFFKTTRRVMVSIPCVALPSYLLGF